VSQLSSCGFFVGTASDELHRADTEASCYESARLERPATLYGFCRDSGSV
jgi:hypothetical protein